MSLATAARQDLPKPTTRTFRLPGGRSSSKGYPKTWILATETCHFTCGRGVGVRRQSRSTVAVTRRDSLCVECPWAVLVSDGKEMTIRSKPEISYTQGRDVNPPIPRMRGASGFVLTGKINSRRLGYRDGLFYQRTVFSCALLVNGSVGTKK